MSITVNKINKDMCAEKANAHRPAKKKHCTAHYHTYSYIIYILGCKMV